MFKFIHAADLHLDSPLKGLQRYEGAPIEEIRQATRHALQALVDLAIEEHVAFVLLAGDLYDGDWPDYSTGLHFASAMDKLREAGIAVYGIAGNHDAQNVMTKRLRLPENVTMLSASAPQSVVLDEQPVAIHGQGFATKAVWDNLTLKYPPGHPGLFNIGLLHTCGVADSSHERYAPCSLDDLRGKEYQYWALGHVHHRGVLHDAEPFVAYSGNIQGRHIRETGPKGCLLVTVDDHQRCDAAFVPLDVMRWEHCHVDATGVEHADDVLTKVASALREQTSSAAERWVAMRVEVRGACAAHQQLAARPQRWMNEIRSLANESGGQVWLEKIKLDTSAPRTVGLHRGEGPWGELLDVLGELQSDDAALMSLFEEFADLRKKLPAELIEGDEPLGLDQSDWLRARLRQVEPLLCERLSGVMEESR